MITRKKIIFTGGGTAGHVIPNIVLIEKFHKENWKITYIGSKTGIEKELITKLNVPYYAISSGKLRRYFSWQNFLDPFKIIYGIIQSLILCFKSKPNVVFSKGGFVSFPVVVAAWLFRIPVITHESDLTIGLANRFSSPFATKICLSFAETIKQIKNKNKIVVTGIPIRQEILNGDPDQGRRICGFHSDKKIITILGGSLGATKINHIIRKLLPKLLENFQIIHICGKNKMDSNYHNPSYKQFEYLHDEFPHILAASDLIISRSGANSIYELLTLQKPNILLPLAKIASRGDQIVNAKYCNQKGFSEIILDEELTTKILLEKIMILDKNKENMIAAMEKFEILPTVDIIINLAIETMVNW